MELSQLSDGPLNGSNWSAICELRQSETQPVAETTFLADHTYMHKTGLFWQNFFMTSPETSHTRNVANELSFPLVTHTTHLGTRFGRYSLLNSCSSSEHIMDRLDCSCSVRFLGQKWVRLARVRIQLLKEIGSAFRCLLKHTFLTIVATVMAF
jgi:hypothetical protein